MSYAMGLPKAAGCGCGTTSAIAGASSANSAMIVSGLSAQAAMDTDLIIDQGTTQEILMCFTSGAIGEEVKCIKKNGTLVFGKDKRPCYKAGDLVRLVGFVDCNADESQIFKVDAPATLVDNLWDVKLVATVTPPGPDPVKTFEMLEFDAAGQYCFSGGSLTQLPIGCVQQKAREAKVAPRLLVHIPAGNLAITGAIFARNDYFSEFGVTFEGGTVVTVANSVIGRVKAGDFIQSKDASIAEPIKVVEVRSVEVMKEDGNGTEWIEKWTLEKPVIATSCALVQVRRGLAVDLEIVKEGDCWRVIVPGADSAGMAFPEEWKTDKGYYIGKYTISATWAVMRDGKLAPRSEIMKAGNAYVRPTHMFSVPKM